jgi:hypothetical protein
VPYCTLEPTKLTFRPGVRCGSYRMKRTVAGNFCGRTAGDVEIAATPFHGLNECTHPPKKLRQRNGQHQSHGQSVDRSMEGTEDFTRGSTATRPKSGTNDTQFGPMSAGEIRQRLTVAWSSLPSLRSAGSRRNASLRQQAGVSGLVSPAYAAFVVPRTPQQEGCTPVRNALALLGSPGRDGPSRQPSCAASTDSSGAGRDAGPPLSSPAFSPDGPGCRSRQRPCSLRGRTPSWSRQHWAGAAGRPKLAQRPRQHAHWRSTVAAHARWKGWVRRTQSPASDGQHWLRCTLGASAARALLGRAGAG